MARRRHKSKEPTAAARFMERDKGAVTYEVYGGLRTLGASDDSDGVGIIESDEDARDVGSGADGVDVAEVFLDGDARDVDAVDVDVDFFLGDEAQHQNDLERNMIGPLCSVSHVGGEGVSEQESLRLLMEERKKKASW